MQNNDPRIAGYTSLTPGLLDNVKVGDKVIRSFGMGELKMPMTVTKITDTEIKCGGWRFDRRFGFEIDDDLGWGAHGTGTWLSLS